MRSAARIHFGAFALGAVALLGCNTSSLVTHIPARTDPAAMTGAMPQDLQAGASSVDLTPIPGIPLGGYSTEAKVSRGFWTRLRARAIYLEDANSKALVLVSSDLMIMPSGLVDRVVELLQQTTTGSDMTGAIGAPLYTIGRENLLMAATETHQSPGNFFDSKLYNAYSSPQVGFDPELFEFLARQLTKGIKKAYAARRPAVLQTSHFSGTSAASYKIPSFVRNRSFDAFLLNPEAERVLGGNASLPLCPVTAPGWPSDYADPRACRAVNARVDLLELLDKSSLDPIALAVFVPAHITVLDAQTEVYSSDVFGVAETMLEARMLHDTKCGKNGATIPPVVAIFNGAQGDVSLWWWDQQRNREGAIALATQLSDHVCGRLYAGLRVPPVPPAIGFQFDYVSVANQSFVDTDGYPRHTTMKPATGAAELGGAEDQRTVFYDIGQKEGRRNYARHADGAKHPPLYGELLGWKFDPVGDEFRNNRPPYLAPIAVYRIADVALVGFPSEPTTMVGLHIREALQKKLSLPTSEQVLLTSFTNGHISYVTTSQEYDRQTYEGASNYWGPATGPFLQHEIDRIAGQFSAMGTAPPKAWIQSYETGMPRVFEPRNTWGSVYDPDEGLANIAERGGDAVRDFPTYCWRDEIPSLAAGDSCSRVQPEVRVVDKASGDTLVLDHLPQDNHGFGLVTVMVAVSDKQMEWCGIWLRPTSGVPTASTCRIRVAAISGATHESDDFACATGAPFSRPRDTSNNLLTPLEPNDGSSFWCTPPLDLLGWCSTTCKAGSL